jgi:hypothetical protein
MVGDREQYWKFKIGQDKRQASNMTLTRGSRSSTTEIDTFFARRRRVDNPGDQSGKTYSVEMT